MHASHYIELMKHCKTNQVSCKQLASISLWHLPQWIDYTSTYVHGIGINFFSLIQYRILGKF